MHPINIVADNINVLFKRNKKYNPAVQWTDLNIYFRYNGKIIKRRPTILTKDRIVKDHQELMEIFERQEWTEEEKQEEIRWNLGNFKSINQFKKYKKPILRMVYDQPESEEVYQDLYIDADKNEYGYKPYLVELIVPENDLTIDVLKKAAQTYLEDCFHVKAKLSDINFINNFSDEEIEKQWKEFCHKKEMDKDAKAEGKPVRWVVTDEMAKDLFGEDIRSVIKEGNKTTITYESGDVVVEVAPKLKFVKKKSKKKLKK